MVKLLRWILCWGHYYIGDAVYDTIGFDTALGYRVSSYFILRSSDFQREEETPPMWPWSEEIYEE